MSSQLTPQQLCGILNFILGLPVKRSPSGGLARREGLGPCVVSTWTRKRRRTLELWVDAMLISEGVVPGALMVHGRLIEFPKELILWSNPGWFKRVHTAVRPGTSRSETPIGQAG